MKEWSNGVRGPGARVMSVRGGGASYECVGRCIRVGVQGRGELGE